MNNRINYRRKLKDIKVIKYVLRRPAVQLNIELLLANNLRPKLDAVIKTVIPARKFLALNIRHPVI